jgi:hypothetical protein
VALVAWTAAIVVVADALRVAGRQLDDERVPLLGVLAAFVFAAQTLNLPVGGGTSGHRMGAALAAVLLGPWLACLVMVVVLGAQAFLFADGGITALGANIVVTGILGALLAGFVLGWAQRAVSTTRPRGGDHRRGPQRRAGLATRPVLPTHRLRIGARRRAGGLSRAQDLAQAVRRDRSRGGRRGPCS